jgi:hypothetical protein
MRQQPGRRLIASRRARVAAGVVLACALVLGPAGGEGWARRAQGVEVPASLVAEVAIRVKELAADSPQYAGYQAEVSNIQSLAELEGIVGAIAPAFVDPADDLPYSTQGAQGSADLLQWSAGWLPPTAPAKAQLAEVQQAVDALTWRAVAAYDSGTPSGAELIKFVTEPSGDTGVCNQDTNTKLEDDASSLLARAKYGEPAVLSTTSPKPQGYSWVFSDGFGTLVLGDYYGFGHGTIEVDVTRSIDVIPLAQVERDGTVAPVDQATLFFVGRTGLGLRTAGTSNPPPDMSATITARPVPAGWEASGRDWDLRSGPGASLGTVAYTAAGSSHKLPLPSALLRSIRTSVRTPVALALGTAPQEPPPAFPPKDGDLTGCGRWNESVATYDQVLVYHQTFAAQPVGLATVSGDVRDRAGGALAKVRLEAIGRTLAGRSVRSEAFTDQRGEYRLELQPGSYLVRPQGEPPGQPLGGLWATTSCAPGCQLSPRNPGSATVVLGAHGSTRLNLVYRLADLVAESVEVTQAVQDDTWLRPASVAVPGFAGPLRGGDYTGVPLVEGVSTVVRLYAYEAPGFGASPVDGVGARLLGYRREGNELVELPGSPLSPYALAGTGSRLLTVGPTLPRDRTVDDGAYTFDLPPSWTKVGELTLVGEVDPAVGDRRPIADCCDQKTAFALTGIPVRAIKKIVVTPVEVVYRWPTQPHALTVPDFKFDWKRVEDVLPLPRDAFELKPYPQRVVSLTPEVGALRRRYQLTQPDLSDCITSTPCRSAFHRDVLGAIAALHLPNGPRNFVIGYMIPADGVTSHTGGIAAVGDWHPSRPLSGLAHEFMHLLGFHHASDACKGGDFDNGGSFDPWPPDQRGYIQGIGLDKSSRGFPYRILAPNSAIDHWYDVMSYCNQGDDADTWISTRNWTRFVDELG